MKGYIPVDVFNKSEIENAAVYYIFWNNLFDINIKNIPYCSLNFDELIEKDKITLFNKEYKVPNKKTNDKKSQKIRNISIDFIENELIGLKYYDCVIDTYNKLKTYNKMKNTNE
jgi:hypothetical protein